MPDISAIAPYAKHFARPLDDVAADLESYAKLLGKWQAVQNLVSRETLAQVWTRHFADSLQVLSLVKADDQRFLDLGSGGGFPALPLAIASKGTGRSFVLIEPTARKVSFLRTVARDLDLNVTVIGRRSEEIDSRETGVPDVITSRALAAMPQLCSWMAPFFGPKTRALLHKGREHVEELTESGAQWHHDVVVTRSDTDPGGVIVEVTNLRGKSVI
ncbi:16S rRNA (guanine(527)-N(7))-methyltransferase RsmG [Devosia sp. XJ19-1]|uniref:Ribosomal RNA small subunit methyltransferase G n=1 Tax=Devosia ureilytica TaxID=2952754 RepID=A0A9Q4AND6_9HYPH|nr:16S rRNA (guanine(527)-N(7))-methyltransferase RsmG [Devosia ureilytica]MCP8882889.1 16S rRNA (guanine(527)-N(7))-methyltransferase RsmG [Devosia ureilytica]MCP8886743.1 16S rRNA (guanine(527)-N(7))-methyltransferase RsmG [Devosia ureilytica]